MDQHGADALRWFMAAGGSPWQRAGSGTRRSRRSSARRCSPTGTPRRSTRCTPARTTGRRWRSPAPAVADRPLLDRWAAVRDAPAGAATSTAALEAFDTQRAGRLLADLRRRPVQLVRAPVAPPVLGRRPVGARDPARVPVRRHAAAGAVHAVRHRAGLAGRRARRSAGAAGLGAPGGLAGGRRRAGRRRASPRRWRWSAGWSSWAGRPAPSPGCAPASRWAARWSSRARLGRRCPRSCGQQVADELNVARLSSRSAGRRLVDTQRQGQLPGARQALRQADPGGRGRDRRGRRRARWPTSLRASGTADGGPSTAPRSRCRPTR